MLCKDPYVPYLPLSFFPSLYSPLLEFSDFLPFRRFADISLYSSFFFFLPLFPNFYTGIINLIFPAVISFFLRFLLFFPKYSSSCSSFIRSFSSFIIYFLFIALLYHTLLFSPPSILRPFTFPFLFHFFNLILSFHPPFFLLFLFSFPLIPFFYSPLLPIFSLHYIPPFSSLPLLNSSSLFLFPFFVLFCFFLVTRIQVSGVSGVTETQVLVVGRPLSLPSRPIKIFM